MKLVISFILIFSSLSISAQSLFEDAERSLMMKNYPRVIELCSSLLTTEPDRDDVKLVMGMAYQGMQDHSTFLT